MEAIIKYAPTAPPQIQDLMQEFFASKNGRTMGVYQEGIRAFARWANVEEREVGKLLLGEGQQKANWLALRFRQHLEQAGYSASTINVRLYALRALSEFANAAGLVSWTIKVRGLKKERRRNTRGPTEDEVKRIIALASSSPPEEDLSSKLRRLRDEAIIRLAFTMGFRRNEILTLRVEDLDLATRRVSVLQKGKHERAGFELTDKLYELLRSYRQGLNGQEMLFDLSANGLWRIVRRLSIRAIGRPVHPHAFRHSAGTLILNMTGNIYNSQKLLRHANSSTTDIYLDDPANLHHSLAQQLEDRIG
jgi:integrase